MDLSQSLAELRRLGLHLDPAEAQEEAERRRVRLNTRIYPGMRALGYVLLIIVVAVHNAIIFGDVSWGAILGFTLVTEAFVLLSWLAVRRWFLSFPPLLGWDLADLMFVADLVLWAWALHLMGGPLALLWFLPLLRVADHHDVKKVWVFAHLAPLVYLAGAYWPPRPPGAAIGPDLLKVAFLYVAGLYIAWTGLPARWLREQREAAIGAAGALLARLTERTERLDEARRSHGAMLEEIRGGVRTSLIEIVGFSRFLLRNEGPRSRAQESYLQRIHDEGRSVLRALDALPERAATVWPSVSLSGLLQSASAEEAGQSEEWREAAMLELPAGDIEVRTDAPRLKAMLRHLLAAGRHFQGGPPRVELQVDAGTGLAEAVVLRCAARVTSGSTADSDLFNPFTAGATGDTREMTARMELSMARSIGESLGYGVAVSGGEAGTSVTVRLR